MITIGYCTRETDDNHKIHLVKSCGLNLKEIQVIEIVNTGDRSLTECYNEILSKAIYKTVVFCHSDITIETKQWGKKLLRLFEKNPEYGIIGVAGSKQLPVSGKWWENPRKMYGRVSHTHEGKTWLSTYSKDLNQDLEETVIVDGVFFAINTDKIIEKFNETVLGFHFYDITFSFENFLKGVKVGVSTLIRINHKSIGMVNDEWEKNRLKFVERFSEQLPVSISKKLRTSEHLKIMLVSLAFNDSSPKSKIILEIATKLKDLGHDVTICSNSSGQISVISKQRGIRLAPIQQPPGFILGDGKWKLKDGHGKEVVSQNNVLYKLKDIVFDTIHTFDDEIIEHLIKLYGNSNLLNTRFPNGLFVTEKNSLVRETIDLDNEPSTKQQIDIGLILDKYVSII